MFRVWGLGSVFRDFLQFASFFSSCAQVLAVACVSLFVSFSFSIFRLICVFQIPSHRSSLVLFTFYVSVRCLLIPVPSSHSHSASRTSTSHLRYFLRPFRHFSSFFLPVPSCACCHAQVLLADSRWSELQQLSLFVNQGLATASTLRQQAVAAFSASSR